jgi:hypothetical protein
MKVVCFGYLGFLKIEKQFIFSDNFLDISRFWSWNREHILAIHERLSKNAEPPTFVADVSRFVWKLGIPKSHDSHWFIILLSKIPPNRVYLVYLWCIFLEKPIWTDGLRR